MIRERGIDELGMRQKKQRKHTVPRVRKNTYKATVPRRSTVLLHVLYSTCAHVHRDRPTKPRGTRNQLE